MFDGRQLAFGRLDARVHVFFIHLSRRDIINASLANIEVGNVRSESGQYGFTVLVLLIMDVSAITEIIDALLGQPVSLEELVGFFDDFPHENKCDRVYP